MFRWSPSILSPKLASGIIRLGGVRAQVLKIQVDVLSKLPCSIIQCMPVFEWEQTCPWLFICIHTHTIHCSVDAWIQANVTNQPLGQDRAAALVPHSPNQLNWKIEWEQLYLNPCPRDQVRLANTDCVHANNLGHCFTKFTPWSIMYQCMDRESRKFLKGESCLKKR